MNGSFFSSPTFPQATSNNENISPPGNNFSTVVFPIEQSLIENILRLNKGKLVKVYASYPDSKEWRDKVYVGTIEQAGKDHLILSTPNKGNWFLLRMIYINYIEFDTTIDYNKDYSDTFD